MKDRNPAAAKVVASSADLAEADDVAFDIRDRTDKGI
jgi:thymidine phosphorylase